MSTYSIKELGIISGLQPHTIRTWELRYNLLKPLRTGTNIRYYNDEQLRKLLNVCELMNAGLKISHISRLNKAQIDSEMDKVIAGSFEKDFQFDVIINQALIAAATFDETLFEKTFSNALLRFGLTGTYIKVIYPLLVRVGLMWGKGDVIPAQEHFFTNLIKQKLFASIDSLPLPERSKQTWVLFLNEDEEHEIGLLFASYILRQQGVRVIYLGGKVPYENLVQVVKKSKATRLYTFFVRNNPPAKVKKLIDDLSAEFRRAVILVSGNKDLVKGVKLNKRIEWISDIDSLLNRIGK